MVIAAVVIGYRPTQRRWGAEGIESMFVVAGICLAVALVPAAIMGFVAARWPQHLGQAAFAGTGIRLLLTLSGLLIYQVLAQPQLGAFLCWATILYLLLLATETTIAVLAVRRYHPAAPVNKGGTAS